MKNDICPIIRNLTKSHFEETKSTCKFCFSLKMPCEVLDAQVVYIILLTLFNPSHNEVVEGI